ncbi:hypothetical protein OPV22_011830 [Ensete ventricosum]|uniref:Uncharacterized protein n=1 Tax=Ensete ventricosum TaxID=4639 RepID=A0AAV8RAK5_ENSVE|nr:hypothetical protein OPV22_011830 [Ensete ventricosum]
MKQPKQTKLGTSRSADRVNPASRTLTLNPSRLLAASDDLLHRASRQELDVLLPPPLPPRPHRPRFLAFDG